MIFFVFVFLSLAFSVPCFAFGTSGSSGCESDCGKCHSFTTEEASGIVRKMNSSAKVTGVRLSPVKGLWEIAVDDNGRKGVFYTDFTKKFVVAGPIIEIDNLSNKTRESIGEGQVVRKVDVSKIPLDDAIVMGAPDAKIRVIVFTDPECPFCSRLHQEMKKVVQERKDIVFYIKLFPLSIHKDSYWKAKAIECKKSLQMMDDNFDGKPIPRIECGTDRIDENLKLAASLGITSTPTLILPDGRVHEGTLPADKLIELISSKQ